MERDQASMPPATDCAFPKPCWRSQLATERERAPWWQSTARGASSSSSLKARPGTSFMGITTAPERAAVAISQGSRTSRRSGGVVPVSLCCSCSTVISRSMGAGYKPAVRVILPGAENGEEDGSGPSSPCHSQRCFFFEKATSYFSSSSSRPWCRWCRSSCGLPGPWRRDCPAYFPGSASASRRRAGEARSRPSA